MALAGNGQSDTRETDTGRALWERHAGREEEELIMGSSGRHQADDTGGPYPAGRSTALRTTCAPRRVGHTRRGGVGEGRQCSLASALAGLEREHSALLLALREIEETPVAPTDGVTDSEPVREALRALLRDDLRQTEHALECAASGIYGVCEDCYRPISPSRLELRPSTTRCAACERAREGQLRSYVD